MKSARQEVLDTLQLLLVQSGERLRDAAELLRDPELPPDDLLMRTEIHVTRAIDAVVASRKVIRDGR